MKTAQDRYYNDPAYRQVVDMMEHLIHQCVLTPAEVREAAMLASINYELRRPRNLVVVIPGVVENEGFIYGPTSQVRQMIREGIIAEEHYARISTEPAPGHAEEPLTQSGTPRGKSRDAGT